jgi:ATP-dependent helicase/DNAse subunit B
VKGLCYANKTAFAQKGPDYTETNIEDPKVRELLYAEQGLPSQLREHAEASSAQGLAFASNHLETYKACPFAYLLKRGLRISEQRYQTELENAQALGTYYHYLLEKLFKQIRDKDKAFLPEKVEDYRLSLNDIINESIETSYCAENGLIPSLVLSLKPKIEELIGKLLDEEAKRYPGFLLASLEKWYWRIEKEIDVILYGKIDRISENPETGSLLLIDYKKKKLPGKSEILGTGGDPENISSFQMALYLYLLERPGQAALDAAYYSLEDTGFKSIYGGESPLIDEERKDLVIHQLEKTIRETAGGIREGDYQIPPIEADSCPFRSICRNRYTTAV